MNNSQIIQTLASTHPDFNHFQSEYSDLPKVKIPTELLEQTLSLLEEDPEQAAVITAMRNNVSVHA